MPKRASKPAPAAPPAPPTRRAPSASEPKPVRRIAATSPGETRPGNDGGGVRVLCVDDHAVLVEGLKAQFALHARVRCVGHLPDASRLLEEVARINPDVVLLDIEMPGPDAFETADRLHHMHPGVRIIILSAHIRDGYIAAAAKCGASGYFAKSDDLEAIVSGLREVAHNTAGTFVMGPKVKDHCRPASAVASTAVPSSSSGDRFTVGTRGKRAGRGTKTNASAADGARPTTRLESLSVREVEILRLIGKGLSRTQIAAELSRAAKTVDGHQDRMIRKLGVASRADLMRLAIREGFAEA